MGTIAFSSTSRSKAALTPITAGHPVARIEQNSPAHIAQEFFRFEIATATAGSILGINPFDQPDVEASKAKTRELSSAYERSGMPPEETPICSEG